jgi:hypothetical protein
MEIKRTTEIFVETKKRLVILRPENAGQILCSQCGEQMIEAEIAAALLAVSRRFVYRQIEAGGAHFAETATGILLICPDSIDGRSQQPE